MGKAKGFLEGLPQDGFLPDELAMRAALLALMSAADGPLLLSHAAKDPSIIQRRSKLLPQEVPLRVWIEERIGGEVRLERDSEGLFLLEDANAKPGVQPAAKGKGAPREREPVQQR